MKDADNPPESLLGEAGCVDFHAVDGDYDLKGGVADNFFVMSRDSCGEQIGFEAIVLVTQACKIALLKGVGGCEAVKITVFGEEDVGTGHIVDRHQDFYLVTIHHRVNA